GIFLSRRFFRVISPRLRNWLPLVHDVLTNDVIPLLHCQLNTPSTLLRVVVGDELNTFLGLIKNYPLDNNITSK
ncbi:hypothetical protein QYM36_008887, partial [Artemia franciscana]